MQKDYSVQEQMSFLHTKNAVVLITYGYTNGVEKRKRGKHINVNDYLSLKSAKIDFNSDNYLNQLFTKLQFGWKSYFERCVASGYSTILTRQNIMRERAIWQR